jgi:hypothetical protein
MRKRFAVIAVTLLFATMAIAQDTPRMETFLGYTYVRANSATDVPAFSANGGGGQFVYDFDKWFGAVADLGAVHNGNLGGNQLDSTFFNFLFGPRISLRYSRIHPYFQILWGGVYAATSKQIEVLPVSAGVLGSTTVVNPDQVIQARIGGSQTAFAMVVGGGLDIKISRVVSFRPIELDYYLTRLQNLRSMNDNNQNNLRYTAGFNFTFGAR